MPNSLEKPVLWVEGKDDLHSILALLARYGINYDAKPCPMHYPQIRESGSFTKMLQDMEMSIETAILKPIGFVLDADFPLQKRWDEVCYRLRKVGFNPPSSPPDDGFCEYTKEHKTTVGVWLMPDNQHDGKLETFLQTLIDEKDFLIDHAADSTRNAKTLGAKFTESDQEKAVLHTWLAWQREPGRPFGLAITQKFFIRHDSPAAVSFVAWFKKLYSIDADQTASLPTT